MKKSDEVTGGRKRKDGTEYLLIGKDGKPYTFLEADEKKSTQTVKPPVRVTPPRAAKLRNLPPPKTIQEKIYQCSECDTCFETSNELLKHYLMHIKEKPYECGCCGKSFNCSSSLTRHRMIHTGKRPYKCSLCQKGFRSTGELVRHQVVHTGEKPYTCGICYVKFTLKKNLKRHQRKQHDGRVFASKPVNSESTFQGQSSQHVSEVEVVLEEDDCSPLTEESMEEEEEEEEEEEKEEEEEEVEDEDNQIQVCKIKEEHFFDLPSEAPTSDWRQKKLSESSDLLRSTYSSMQFGQENLDGNEVVNNNSLPGDIKFQCVACKKLFLTQDVLQTHQCALPDTYGNDCFITYSTSSLQGPKLNDGGTYLNCSTCGNSFRWPSSLHQHQKVHLKEWGNKCGEHQKRYWQVSSKSYHSSGKLFLCNICQNAFEDSNALAAHQKVHYRDQPYQCGICQERFSELRSLQKHQEMHSDETTAEQGLSFQVSSKEQRQEIFANMHHSFDAGSSSGRENLHHWIPSEVTDSFHSGKRLYKCTTCERYFKTFSSLTVHYLEHTKHKPFKCLICGETFKKSSYLEQHKLVHTSMRPFKCVICQKGFRNKCDLQRHHLVHTGEKPFQCPVCPIRFTQKSHLQRHKRKQHDCMPAYYDIIMEIKGQRAASSSSSQ